MITILLTWALYAGDPNVTLLVAHAFVREPVVLPCSDPNEGMCITEYMKVWEDYQDLPVTATQASWTVNLPSKAVAYAEVFAAREMADGTCLSP